jgi:hypothetical protein
MRPVSLSHYVCQGKPESEVARGRNYVSKLRPQYIPPLNGVQGIQVTDWHDGAIIPAEFIPLLLFKTYYLPCVEIGRQDDSRIFRQAGQVLVIQISRKCNSPTYNRPHLEKWIERVRCERKG